MDARITAIGGRPLGVRKSDDLYNTSGVLTETPIRPDSHELIHQLRLKHEAALESVRSSRWQIEHGENFHKELTKAIEEARISGIRLREALAELVETILGDGYTARIVLYPSYTNEE